MRRECALRRIARNLLGVAVGAGFAAGLWATPQAAAPPVQPTPTKAPAGMVNTDDPEKPGQFMWQPERSPDGPVVVVVSIPEQLAHVYRNGVEIGVSTVSTGRPGHLTPTGVFTILQKQTTHESTIYQGASMPFMERLTWDGIAMHAGNLPGYPASHGCVRLPLQFSRLLYGVTEKGGTVVIADDKSPQPEEAHPGELLAPDDSAPGAGTSQFAWNPEKSPGGPVSIVLSGKDRRVYVYRNGIDIGWADVTFVGPPGNLGRIVYTALEGASTEPNKWAPGRPMRRWQAIRLDRPEGAAADLADRVRVPPDFAKVVYDVIVPGTTLFVTDEAAQPETRTAPGFTVLAAGAAPVSK